jgi:hypothetical protein
MQEHFAALEGAGCRELPICSATLTLLNHAFESCGFSEFPQQTDGTSESAGGRQQESGSASSSDQGLWQGRSACKLAHPSGPFRKGTSLHPTKIGILGEVKEALRMGHGEEAQGKACSASLIG